MAGSISLSLTQRYDKNTHEPLSGGLLYFYAAGTTTPQSAYQDISLTIPWANPLTLDSGGNVPQLFFADGYIKFRLANASGVTQIASDYVLVLGPTSGAGAAPSVDATTIMQTGFLAAYYGTGARTGFVRANGRTIGSAASGATERANADCEDLFANLWTEDANLSVSTGRGASAAADFAANKTIQLPSWRGRTLAFLDDMGNSAAGILTSTTMSPDGITLGADGGTQTRAIGQANLPSVNFVVAAGQTVSVTASRSGGVAGLGSTGYGIDGNSTESVTSTGTVTSAGTAASGGSGTALNVMQPTRLATLYIKL